MVFCFNPFQDNGIYRGVRLASGQDIFSHKLLLDPSFTLQSQSDSPSDLLHKIFNFLSLRDAKGKVARGICITRSSLKPDVSNFLAVYPPRCKIKLLVLLQYLIGTNRNHKLLTIFSFFF